MMISTLRCSPLFFILISAICSLSTTLPLYAQTVPESDSLALIALYNSTDGDNWTRNDNWLEGPVSTWYGVTLWDVGGVADIELPNNNLTGNLPEELGDYTALNHLDLSNNKIEGPIPASIGNLTSLQFLWLRANQLSGELPPEIGNLKALISLHTSENQLSGSIPNAIGNLSNLTTLSMGYNQHSGKLPNEIWNLQNLSFLSFSSNQLEGTIPSSIQNLENLTTLYLGNNHFNGSIPEEIGSLTKLELLDLTLNDFTGELPVSIGNLTNLEHFSISYCKIQGDVPNSIKNSINLKHLDLYGNDLRSLPDLSSLNISSINISNNKFSFKDILPNINLFQDQYEYSPQQKIGESGTINLEIGENYSLHIQIDSTISDNQYTWFKDGHIIKTSNLLEINNADFSDIGDYICQVTNPNVPGLKLFSNPITISISYPDGRTVSESDSLALVEIFNSTGGENWSNKNNWFTGPISSWTGVVIRDGRIKELNLPSNNLSGNLPDAIQNLIDLEKFHLSGNQLSGEIPHQIQHLKELRYLWLQNNNLSGNIPKEIAQLTNLISIDLQSNNLSGNIPKEIAQLTNLISIDLLNNQLTGSLPDEISQLQNLEILNLGENKIAGTIPISIGNLKKLRWLALNSNNLEGEVPKEIGNLLTLQHLFLNMNNLKGTIPVTLGQLKNLELLDISNNNLEGEVAEELADLPKLSNLAISGNAFTKVPDLTSINQFRINHNRLSFDDILPNVLNKEEYYNYWQSNLTEDTEISIEEGTTYTIDLKIDKEVEDNEYTWYKDNVEIAILDSNKFTLDKVSPYDAGSYHCEIRNPTLPKLNLRTGKFLVNVGDVKAVGSVIAADSLALADLYKSTHGEKWHRNDNWLKSPVYNWFGIQIWNKRVVSINLPANNLSGTLPQEIEALTGLSILDLKDNQFNGIIPVEVGNLTWLHSLNLSNNEFSGSIPNSFGNFTRIKFIYLSNNQLNGQIPEELENLKDLDVFSINHNNFDSNTTIPQAILDSANINIVGNQFTFQNIITALEVALKNSNDFFYNPQDTIGNEKIITAENNQPFILDLQIDSAIATNNYQWFKDGIAFATTNTNNLIFEKITPSDAGVYTCEITNSQVPNLTLKIAPISLKVKKEQTITFDSILGKTYVDEPFLLSATSDAGLEVFFEVVSGPAQLSGDTLTITGTGDITVKAFSEGNDTYLPTETERSFTVVQGSQTLTFDTIPDKTLGDAPFALMASASSGLPVSFHVEGPALLDGTTLTLTDTGKVSITAAQPGNENYLPAEEVIRTFVVKAATFSLSGKVKTQAGDPVGSGTVILYTPNEAERLTTFQTGVLQTDGSYAFTNLKAGDYSVGVIPDDPAFLTTYLGDVVIRSEATLISLFQNTENQYITLISQTETLTGNATLSGILILEENNGGNRILTSAAEVEGTPLPEVAVYLVNASGDVIAHDVTDAEGKFSFTHIAAGSYHFKADYEGMPHDADNFSIEVSDKDMEVTALVAKEGIIRVQEVSVVTGTADERTQAPVLLYPNPTEGKFSILVDMHWVGGSLLIHNMHGQPLVQKSIHSSKLTFDLSQEKAGVYVITLQKGESWQVLRVSKF